MAPADTLANLHDDDAERSVLGGILAKPGVLLRLTLEVRDFFNPRNQAVYQAMRSLDERESVIDPTTLAAELARLGKLGAFGGQDDVRALAYVGRLALTGASASNVEHYARILERHARRRGVLEAFDELARKIRTSDGVEGEDVVLEAIGRLQKLDLREPDPTRALGDLMRDEISSIEDDLAAHDRGDHIGGMPTGLDRLDALTGGIPTGVVTLVLGETGHGKSTLAMTFARAARTAGDVPLIFSYEDGNTSFARRSLAQESGVPTQVIGRRSFRPGEAQRVVSDGMANAGQRRERIARFRGETVAELARTVRRLRARGPEAGAKSIGRLVIVDYLQAIPKPRERWVNSTPEAIAEISQQLEDLAAQEQIALVVFAQVNDEPMKRQDHRPVLRDCADGRAAVKGCKLGLAIYRPSMYDDQADPLYGEILVLKNNQGEINKRAAVRLDLATHTIRDLPVEAVKAEQQALGGV